MTTPTPPSPGQALYASIWKGLGKQWADMNHSAKCQWHIHAAAAVSAHFRRLGKRGGSQHTKAQLTARAKGNRASWAAGARR